MNSYPAELLMQLAPVMFVAGIEKISPQPSAGISEALTPTSPSMPSSKRANQIDPFVVLMQRLREMIGAQRKPAVWVPESLRKSKTFHVVFVDKVCVAKLIIYLECRYNSLGTLRQLNFHPERYLIQLHPNLRIPLFPPFIPPHLYIQMELLPQYGCENILHSFLPYLSTFCGFLKIKHLLLPRVPL